MDSGTIAKFHCGNIYRYVYEVFRRKTGYIHICEAPSLITQNIFKLLLVFACMSIRFAEKNIST